MSDPAVPRISTLPRSHPSDLQDQLAIERQLMQHIVGALRMALAWDPAPAAAARKLSTLQFITLSWYRHYERLNEVRANGGYMEFVTRSRPHFLPTVNALGRSQRLLAERVRAQTITLHEIEGLGEEFDAACAALQDLLVAHDAHNDQETMLIQEAFLREEGGEG